MPVDVTEGDNWGHAMSKPEDRDAKKLGRPRTPVFIHPPFADSELDTFLNEKEVLEATGIKSPTTLRELWKRAAFPRPMRVSRGRRAWSMAEIIAWQMAKKRERAKR